MRSLWPRLWRDLVLNQIIASPMFPRPLRWRALRRYGMHVEKCHIAPQVWFSDRNIWIGAGTFVNYRCFFASHAPITIGRNCTIAMDVSFITDTHDIGPSARRAGGPRFAPIDVGDGTWIGARATILPGVTIGKGCVVAAGSVVTKDCEADTLYAGVPAKAVRVLDAVGDKAAKPGCP